MHAVSCSSTYNKKFKQIIANNWRGARCSTKAGIRAGGGPMLSFSILMSTVTGRNQTSVNRVVDDVSFAKFQSQLSQTNPVPNPSLSSNEMLTSTGQTSVSELII